jgi:mono/diheme cytochrome c family protein
VLKSLSILCAAILLSFTALGCSGDDDAQPDVARGEYLARSVLGCGLCHTPYNADATLNQSLWLAGNSAVADLIPDDDSMGLVTAPNLTSSATNGLGDWSDAEIKAAITKGMKRDGNAILGLMPYYAYALLSEADLDNLVAYLRTLPADETVIEPTQPLGFPITAAPSLAPSSVPDHNLDASSPEFASAENGKYLAGIACASCHTEEDQAGHAIQTAVLQGNREFYTASYGFPQIGSGGAVEFPPVTRSANLTPDATGIAGYTADDLQTIIKTGMRRDGSGTCVMGFQVGVVLATMDAQDAADIANYLLNLTPVANDTTEGGTIAACTPIFP